MPQHASQSNGRSARASARAIPPMFPFPAEMIWPGAASAGSVAAPMAAWQPMLLAMATWNGQLGAATASIGSEWLEFVSRRLGKDVDCFNRLATCTDVDQAVRVLAAHGQHTVEDYQAEMMTLARLGSGVVCTNVESAYRSLDYKAQAQQKAAKVN